VDRSAESWQYYPDSSPQRLGETDKNEQTREESEENESSSNKIRRKFDSSDSISTEDHSTVAHIRVQVTNAKGLRSALERAPSVEDSVEQEIVIGENILGLHTPLVVPEGRRVKLLGAAPRIKITAEDSGILHVHSGASLTIQDLELTGGSRNRGGAIFNDHGIVTLVNCTLVNNSAAIEGGGLFSAGGQVHLMNVTIAENEAGEAGGALFLSSNAFISIKSIEFRDNYAPAGSDILLGTTEYAHENDLGQYIWRNVIMMNISWVLLLLPVLVGIPWLMVFVVMAPCQWWSSSGFSWGRKGSTLEKSQFEPFHSTKCNPITRKDDMNRSWTIEEQDISSVPRMVTKSFDQANELDLVIVTERASILNPTSTDKCAGESLVDKQCDLEEVATALRSSQNDGTDRPKSKDWRDDECHDHDTQLLLKESLVNLKCFRLTGSVSHGAHASVYKASLSEDAVSCPLPGLNAVMKRHQPLAVKRLKLDEDPNLVVSRWRNEASIWLNISHPNVVTLHGVLCESTLFESFEGLSTFGFGLLLDWHPSSLRDMILGSSRNNHRAFTTDITPRRLQTARDVARGLAHLHELCVVHRDVKASNIMLTHSGTAKISDFGEAMFDSKRSQKPNYASIRGTLLYAAPELLQCEPHGPAVDVWSLAMVIVELLTNRPLYELWKERLGVPQDCNSSAILNPSRAFGWRPSLEALQDIPLAGLISQCLSMSPSARPSMRTVLACIEKELDSLTELSQKYNSIFPQRTLSRTPPKRPCASRQPHTYGKDPPYSCASLLLPSSIRSVPSLQQQVTTRIVGSNSIQTMTRKTITTPPKTFTSATSMSCSVSREQQQQAVSSFRSRWGHYFAEQSTPIALARDRDYRRNSTKAKVNVGVVVQEPMPIPMPL